MRNFTSVFPVARELMAFRMSSPVRSAKPIMNSDLSRNHMSKKQLEKVSGVVLTWGIVMDTRRGSSSSSSFNHSSFSATAAFSNSVFSTLCCCILSHLKS